MHLEHTSLSTRHKRCMKGIRSAYYAMVECARADVSVYPELNGIAELLVEESPLRHLAAAARAMQREMIGSLDIRHNGWRALAAKLQTVTRHWTQ
eukprot:3910471-Amphidinium_carterae.1